MIKQQLAAIYLILIITLFESCTCLYSYSRKAVEEKGVTGSPYVNVSPNGITDGLNLYRLLEATSHKGADSTIIRSLGSKICFVGTNDTVNSVRVGNWEEFYHPSFSKYIRQERDLLLFMTLEKDSAGQKQRINYQYTLRRRRACSVRISH